MKIPNPIKHAPKWAWWTVGGIAAGGLAIRLYQNKTTAADTTNPNPADTAYQYGGSINSGYTTPIITAAQDTTGGDSYGVGGTDWQTGVQGLFDAYDQFFQDVNTQNQGTIGTLLSVIANGGGAPQPAEQTPSPIGSPTPTAQPVAPNAHTAASPVTCASKFPSFPLHNPANGAPSAKSCYRNGCEKKKRMHIYKGGEKVVTGKC